jgi:Zn-dependent peptidase ImmA (M78 family)
MILTAPDIIFCLTKARDITDHYKAECLDSQQPKKSTDLLIEICEKYLDKKVQVFELGIPVSASPSIRGYYVSYGTTYEIYLVPGMNYCWYRFVLCKELFHVILDEERYQTTSIYDHIQEVMTAFPAAQVGSPAPVSEALAEIAAMEFMFPYADRLAIPMPVQNALEIAHRYKIPQAFVEEYMGESYMNGLKPYMVK